MQVQPLYERILIRRIEQDELTPGGLHIPDVGKETQQEAVVLAVGTGYVLKEGVIFPITVKVGDRVLVGRYSGTDIKLNGEMVSIVKEDEVLAILRD